MLGKLYSFNNTPTIDTTVDVSFIIHDFEKSWNNQIISMEVCKQNMNTLINQPIVVKYYATGDSSTDSFGDHAVTIGKSRDDDSDIVEFKTTPIGVFTNAYIKEIDGKDVLVGEGKLWSDRFYNIVSLLSQMISEGVEVKCSCEYLFQNYIMKDGIQYPQSPISYTGHCILNSDPNRGVGVVLPAYDCSKVLSFNEAINADIISINNKENKKEGDNVSVANEEQVTIETIESVETVEVVEIVEAEPSLNEMEETVVESVDEDIVSVNEIEDEELVEQEELEKSTNDISLIDEKEKAVIELKNKIVTAKSPTSQDFWLSKWNIYNGYFVYEDFVDGEWAYFKQTFSMGIDGNVILGDEIVKVKAEEVWIPVASYNQIVEEKVSLADEIMSLNAQIDELKVYKCKHEEFVLNEKLNEAMDTYKEKFAVVNAMDKFESDEVKELVKETLVEEKSLNAKSKLADVLLDCISLNKKEEAFETPVIKEICSKKVENLIPSTKKFSDYGLDI